MKPSLNHATGFTLSLLFHGAILTSLLVGQMSMKKNAAPYTDSQLSISMFNAEPQAEEVEITTSETIREATPPLTTPLARPIINKKVITAAQPEPESKPIQKIFSRPDIKKLHEPTVNDATEEKQTRSEPLSSQPSKSPDTKNPAMLDHGIIKTLEAEYLAALRSAIEEKKYYPKRARRLKREGDVIINFVINRIGQIHAIQIQHSSGTKLLDKAAIDAIKRLGHFKPIPPGIPRDKWTLEIPIHYALM